MYQSKYEVQRKLNQVKFALHELNKFKNRVFIKNGIDSDSGCFPMEVRLISFIILARSIFQYACQEAKQSKDKKAKYDSFVNENKIISFFKKLRDSEIHSFSISSSTEISAFSPIENFDSETNILLSKPFNLMVEDLANIDNPKLGTSSHVKIQYQITKHIEATHELITTLKNENKQELAEAIEKGEQIFEGLEFEGTTNMFKLCEIYYESILKFVDYGISMKFIT